MKKIIALLMVFTLALAGCGSNDTPSNADTSDQATDNGTSGETTTDTEETSTLIISTFGLSEDVSEDEIYKPFEDTFNADIVTETGNSSERYTKLAADSQSSIDVIELSQAKSAEGVEAELFEAIDPSKIENYDNLIDSAKALVDSGAGVPYTMNSLVIVYDPEKVDAIESYDDLWSADLAGQISIPEITTTFGPSMVYIAADHAGVDVATDDGAAAFTALEALKANILKTYSKSSDLANMFTSGEISAAVVGDYAVPILKGANENLVFVTPDGAYGNFNTININKNTENLDLAYDYINYRISPELQTIAAGSLNNAPTNKLVELSEEQAAVMPYGDAANALKTVDYAVVNPILANWIDLWNRTLNN